MLTRQPPITLASKDAYIAVCEQMAQLRRTTALCVLFRFVTDELMAIVKSVFAGRPRNPVELQGIHYLPIVSNWSYVRVITAIFKYEIVTYAELRQYGGLVGTFAGRV